MAVALFLKWDGVTPDQYEQVRREANWEGDRPDGAVFHLATFGDGAMRIVDIWESEDAFQRFQESRIVAAAANAGLTGEPEVAFYPVHSTFNPGIPKQ